MTYFKKPIACHNTAESQKSKILDAISQALEKNSGALPTTKNILLVSYYAPSRIHAGGLRILDIYALIKANFPNVKLELLTAKRPAVDVFYDDAERIFDTVYYAPTDQLTPEILNQFIELNPHAYDVIDIQFHEAGHFIDLWRPFGKKILFTPMESQVKCVQVNFNSGAFSSDSPRAAIALAGIKLAAEEIVFANKAHTTVCVSSADAELLSVLSQSPNVTYVDTAISSIEFAKALSEKNLELRPDLKKPIILYCASFISQTNRDALRWYLEHVHPLVMAHVPDYQFQVIGYGSLHEYQSFEGDSVALIGQVPEIAPFMYEAKLAIAPALYGGGFRGKINQYAICGLPCVASEIAGSGMNYADGVDIALANAPEEFAQKCIDLLQNNALNAQIGSAARNRAVTEFTWDSKLPHIQKIYGL